jgi:hypothetical protein
LAGLGARLLDVTVLGQAAAITLLVADPALTAAELSPQPESLTLAHAPSSSSSPETSSMTFAPPRVTHDDPPFHGLGVYLRCYGEFGGSRPPLKQERSQPLVCQFHCA